MATAQDIISSTLVALRQPAITSVPITDPYQQLVLEFFNETKQRVEDATNWRSLDKVITVTVPASTGFGAAGGGYFAALPGTNERSRVRRQPIRGGGMSQSGYAPAIAAADKSIAMVYDTTSPTTSGYFALYEMPLDMLRYNLNATNWQTVSQPQFFALSPGSGDNGGAGSGQQYIYIYPPVNTPRTITVTMVVPQSEFNNSLQDSSGNTNVFVPRYPMLAGLKWRAYEERGEELGPSNAYSQEEFEAALDDAVSIENAEAGNNNDLYLE